MQQLAAYQNSQGMFGFDSGSSLCVSMQCIGNKHFNLRTKTLTGENNYALAA